MAFSTPSMTTCGATFEIVFRGSMLRRYSWLNGWMTKANRLLRLYPPGYSWRGCRSEDVIMSSRSSSVSLASAAPVAASIRASSTAELMVIPSKGCGVSSRTRSTPRLPNSSSRSSDTLELMRVLPASACRSNIMSSS